LVLGAAALGAFADGPGDNKVENVRPVPPPGKEVPQADQSELQAGVDKLGKQIDELRTSLKGKPLLDLLPDVQVYHNAVRYALAHNEFFDPAKEVPKAKAQLQKGLERAEQLRGGKAPWTTATGLVVRGYVSKIDGSVQPYGLVVPASYQPNFPHRYRLDFWLHGRGETLSEVNFVDEHERSAGAFTPPNTFVLHPYGRYCNANKFAGEIDLLEALAHVQKNYPIDENRLCVRGFSMGGAACWQFAAHYPSLWAAAAPGAGFSETADFLQVFQNEKVQPTDYEKKLWHMYDCTDYALNFANLPLVAYSGEIDKQKQAADMMEKALAAEGIKMVHIIGPKTGHSYHPEAKAEVIRRIDHIMEKGRDSTPGTVYFTTWTLRYNQSFWVTVDGMEQQWERAKIVAKTDNVEDADVLVEPQGVTAFTLSFAPGDCPLSVVGKPKIIIGKQHIEGPQVASDRSWTAHFRKDGKDWKVVESTDSDTLRKRHGLQGPIDDAFMDSFMMVRPTGKPINEKVGTWAKNEMEHAIDHWRKQFRGEARVKDDGAITDEDIANSNLVLWGDPSSNKILAKIADKLPIRWGEQELRLGETAFQSDKHVPVFIYPNPLNPKRYVVVNSGFTYREYDYLNNARQVPKLPDFAVVDVSVPVNSRTPGGIVKAGFFTEEWKLPTK
jgi:dienelactone hydrolase